MYEHYQAFSNDTINAITKPEAATPRKGFAFNPQISAKSKDLSKSQRGQRSDKDLSNFLFKEGRVNAVSRKIYIAIKSYSPIIASSPPSAKTVRRSRPNLKESHFTKDNWLLDYLITIFVFYIILLMEPNHALFKDTLLFAQSKAILGLLEKNGATLIRASAVLMHYMEVQRIKYQAGKKPIAHQLLSVQPQRYK
jgi:hypothetical protein